MNFAKQNKQICQQNVELINHRLKNLKLWFSTFKIIEISGIGRRL